MSPTLKDPSFKQKGELTDDLVKEHTVPSCGIGAKDAIQKAGWDGNSAAIAVGLTIGPTGEGVKSARAFGVGFPTPHLKPCHRVPCGPCRHQEHHITLLTLLNSYEIQFENSETLFKCSSGHWLNMTL